MGNESTVYIRTFLLGLLNINDSKVDLNLSGERLEMSLRGGGWCL